jgi:hypothetical protein
MGENEKYKTGKISSEEQMKDFNSSRPGNPRRAICG